MKLKNLLIRKERKFLADLLNERVSDLKKEYDSAIISIQKKLKLYPRKERWVLCGIQYVTVIEREGAQMKWQGPIIGCHEKVERPFSDHNLWKQGKL